MPLAAPYRTVSPRLTAPNWIALLLSFAVLLPVQPPLPVHAEPAAASATTQGWTWQNPLPHGNSLLDVRFASASDGIAVGTHGTVMRTSNGGAGWSVRDAGTTSRLTSVAYADASTLVAVGSQGTLIRSTDGGSSWTPRVSGAWADLNAVHFVDSTHGFAAGGAGTVLKTTNAGLTWTPVYTGTYAELRDVHFVDLELTRFR